jgi:hypothetical protein
MATMPWCMGRRYTLPAVWRLPRVRTSNVRTCETLDGSSLPRKTGLRCSCIATSLCYTQVDVAVKCARRQVTLQNGVYCL